MKNTNLNLSQEEIRVLKKRASQLSRKESKIKTLTISSQVHSEIKKYCVVNNIKIGEWVEKVLLEEIRSN